MVKRMLIDAAYEDEQRIVVLDNETLAEADFHSATKTQIKGNFYLARVTRVEPSLQAAFIDFGHAKHGFLPFSEIHPDYFQIPLADRETLLEEVQNALIERHPDGDLDTERATSAENQPSTENQDTADAKPIEDADTELPATDTENKIDQSKIPGDEGATNQYNAPQTHKTVASSIPSASVISQEAPSLDSSEEKSTNSSQAPQGVAAAPQLSPSAPTQTKQDEDIAKDQSGEVAVKVKSRSRRRGGRKTDKSAEQKSRPSRRQDEDDLDELSDAEFQARTMSQVIMAKKYKIQEVIKRNQVILVQVAKDERGDKGAALTTYLSLPGRYCVLMPNTHRSGGISRRISNTTDRKRLKAVLDELDLAPSMSLIVRTAGAERTKQEIKRDFAYLSRTWDEIRETTLNSFAPALIYEEANLIKRAIRDIYENDTQEVLVAGEGAYRAAKAFMRTLTPSHATRVKNYKHDTPLFQAYGVEGMLESLNRPQVRLPSGGYLVINQTEALVAVDVNSGRSTREKNIEETALRTNLEAARETARQLRLRDMAGLVVIDFIDMEDQKNVTAVERALKEALKPDRARIQLSHISQFGLLELSRQRLRPSVAEATMAPCPTCYGTGYVKSDSANARGIIRQVEQALAKEIADEVTISAAHELVLTLANDQRANLARLEATYQVVIELAIDPQISPSHFRCTLNRMGKIESFGSEPAASSETRPGRSRNRNNRDERGQTDKKNKEPSSPQLNAPSQAGESKDSEEDSDRKRRRRGKRGGRRRGSRQDREVSSVTTANDGPNTDLSNAEQPTVVDVPTTETADVAKSSNITEPIEPEKKPRRTRRNPKKVSTKPPSKDEVILTEQEPVEISNTAPEKTQSKDEDAQVGKANTTKRRGWWSRVRGN